MTTDAALSWLDGNEGADLDRLARWVAVPSVSSDPDRRDDVRRSVDQVAAELARLGFDAVQVHETGGHPAVTGKWHRAGPDAPTVLVYGHVDVQPAEPLAEWHSPPYEMSVRDGRLWGRGVTDDKGQLLMHLRSFEALLATTGALPVNVTVLVDAEEEIGSPNLPGLLAEHPWLGAADVLVVSDSPMLGQNVPAIGYSLRGLIYVEVTVTGLAADLHSGQFGGAVPNAALALARLVAGAVDGDGRVCVPGFYDRVAEIADEERERLAGLPFDESAWLGGIGAVCGVGESGYSTLERTWTRPTLEVNGLVAGHTGRGPKTIVPAFATAKLSMRLVPAQDPDEIGSLVCRYLVDAAGPEVRVEARYDVSSPPVTADPDRPLVDVARSAMEEAFGATCHLIRDGGTIPAVARLQDAFGLPALLLGFGCPDENKHAPDEWLPLDHFRTGPRALVRLWEMLATLPARNLERTVNS